MRNLNFWRCVSSQITSATGAPVCFAYDGVTDRLIVASDDDVIAWKGEAIWKASIKQVTTAKDDHVIGFTYVPVEMVCYIVTKNGSICSIQEDGNEPLEVISVGLFLAAASWSPDSLLLALVSTSGELRLYERNHWTHVQANAFPGDSGIGCFVKVEGCSSLIAAFTEKHVDVGWGKKETQFRGSLGKHPVGKGKGPENEVRLSSQTAQANTGTMICWDSLGESIAVSVFDSACGRRIHIWNSRLDHLRSLEYFPYIGLPISWRPNGGRIVCCEYLEGEAPAIVLFEEKGLRHRQFSLPKFFTGFEVRFMAWSSHSDVLALHLRSPMKDTDFVLLYTVGNYHWYLKKTFRFVEPKVVSCLKWDAEQPKTLHIVFRDWSCLRLDFIWNICRKRSAVAVLDEDTILYTDFSRGITPPPMCQAYVQLDCFVNEVAFGCDENELFALLSDGRISYVSNREGSGVFTTSTVTLEDNALSENPIWYNVSYLDGEHLLLLLNDRSELRLVIAKADWANCNAQIERMHQLPWSYAQAWTFPGPNGVLIYFQTDAGAVLLFDMPALLRDALEISQTSQCSSTSYCSQLDVFESLGKTHLLTLKESNKLYVDDHLLSSAVTSFAPHYNEYLLFTTINHSLFVLPSKRLGQKDFKYDDEASNFNDGLLGDCRPVERGSRIVTTFGTSIVLQLPRGNLETIEPLPLLLASVCGMLDKRNFGEALFLMRKHSLDMNLVYDYDPDSFLKSIRQFITQSGNENLNLFVSQLCPTNAVSSVYKFYFGTTPGGPSVSNMHLNPNRTKDITSILRLMLNEIQSLPERNSFLPATLLLHIKLKEAEKGLLLLKERYLEESRASLFSDGIRHMLYFMTPEQLFNTALGTYDLEFVQMVAQSVQKDPKEYLPILNELEPLDTHYRKFKIDCMLKRPVSALKNLALCGAEYFEELLSHVERYSLYAQAIMIYKDQPEQLMIIRSKFARFLESRRQFSDAALQYEQCGRFDDALRCYKQSLTWRPAWTLMTTKMGMTKNQISEVADFFVKRLCEATRYAAACDVLRQIGGRGGAVAEILIQSCSWLDAFYEVNSLDNDSPMRQKLTDKVVSTARRVIEDANMQLENLTTYSNRLTAVRQEKLDRQSGLHDNHDDRFSDTTSSTSSRTMSMKTRTSVRSNRLPPKKKVTLRKGSAYEDVALLDKLAELVLGVEQRQKEVAELLRVLAYMNLFEEAKRLQSTFSLLKDAISTKISVIWPQVIHVNQLPSLSRQGDRSIVTEDVTDNAVWLADSLVAPKHRSEFDWKLPDVYLDVE